MISSRPEYSSGFTDGAHPANVPSAWVLMPAASAVPMFAWRGPAVLL